MARRTEPLRGSCAGRNRKAWGKSEYGDERKGGPDNATTESGGTREWCRRRFWITSGDTAASRHGKPVGVHVAVQKKIKKNNRSIYSLDLSTTNGIFETIRRAGFGEGDIHGKRSF
jgi:hypothetical protein